MVVVTSGDPADAGYPASARTRMPTPKVRIAVAWLEEARLLERHENHTGCFRGSLMVASLDEGHRAPAPQALGAEADIAPYQQILSILGTGGRR